MKPFDCDYDGPTRPVFRPRQEQPTLREAQPTLHDDTAPTWTGSRSYPPSFVSLGADDAKPATHARSSLGTWFLGLLLLANAVALSAVAFDAVPDRWKRHAVVPRATAQVTTAPRPLVSPAVTLKAQPSPTPPAEPEPPPSLLGPPSPPPTATPTAPAVASPPASATPKPSPRRLRPRNLTPVVP